MKHDWTKLDNGWERVGDALRKDIGCDTQFYSFDDGSSFFHGGELCGSPDTNLSLLTQAVAQRKKCEVEEPKFKFGDWVRRNEGDRRMLRVIHVDDPGRYLALCPVYLTTSWERQEDLSLEKDLPLPSITEGEG